MHRIALITYDISPTRGSEASVSWNFVTKMSRYVHLIVVYGRGDSEIDNYIAEHPLADVDWIGIQKKDVEHFGRGLRQDYYFSLYYRQWHKEVSKIVRGLVDGRKVDLIHYLNPIGFKEPGWCWKIKSVPYVWGPVQGVDNRPLKLYKALGFKGTLFAVVRRVVHNGLFKYFPRVRKAFRRANAIFAATPATAKGLKKYHHCDTVYLTENGIPAMETDTPIELKNGETLHLIWIGGLDVKRKAVGLLLDALLKVQSDNWEISLFGDGSLSSANAEKAARLGEKVKLCGKVPREEVQNAMRNSHLHIISSLGEGNPTTIWESMAKGIPTMTLDHCGMSGVVCNKCGIKIPIESYDRVTSRMADEIDRLIAEPQRVKGLSEGVLHCSKNFMWDNRINLFIDTYNRLIAQYKNKKHSTPDNNDYSGLWE